MASPSNCKDNLSTWKWLVGMVLGLGVTLNGALWAAMVFASDHYVTKDSFRMVVENLRYIRQRVDEMNRELKRK